MKDAQNNDMIFFGPKINDVRKTVEADTTNPSLYTGIARRAFSGHCFASFYFRHEFERESGPFVLIPRDCAEKLFLCVPMKSDLQAHLLILAMAAALTCCHGTASSGYAR